MPKRKTRNDDEMNICGATIKRIRLERGLTQAQLGARMEIKGMVWDQKTVSSVELQRRTLCDYELKAIAEALETSVDVFLTAK